MWVYKNFGPKVGMKPNRHVIPADVPDHSWFQAPFWVFQLKMEWSCLAFEWTCLKSCWWQIWRVNSHQVVDCSPTRNMKLYLSRGHFSSTLACLLVITLCPWYLLWTSAEIDTLTGKKTRGAPIYIYSKVPNRHVGLNERVGWLFSHQKYEALFIKRPLL